jgi:hypothetical protein
MEILMEENESMEILTEEEAMIVNGGCGGCGSSDGFFAKRNADFIDDMEDIKDAALAAKTEIVASCLTFLFCLFKKSILILSGSLIVLTPLIWDIYLSRGVINQSRYSST